VKAFAGNRPHGRPAPRVDPILNGRLTVLTVVKLVVSLARRSEWRVCNCTVPAAVGQPQPRASLLGIIGGRGLLADQRSATVQAWRSPDLDRPTRRGLARVTPRLDTSLAPARSITIRPIVRVRDRCSWRRDRGDRVAPRRRGMVFGLFEKLDVFRPPVIPLHSPWPPRHRNYAFDDYVLNWT
jgi:hypothetical protein